MDINSKTGLLGLFGNPARHSLSPILQNHLIDHYNLNYLYLVFEPDKKKLKEAFEGAKNLGFLGLNITMPFKEEIIGYIQKTSGAASLIRAINTVKFNDGKIKSYGYSTDGDGVIKALEDKKFKWESKNCLILGAGGAAKSAVISIIQKPVSKIFIYDIEKKKTIKLVNNFKLNIEGAAAGKSNTGAGRLKINSSVIGKKLSIIKDLNQIEDKLDSIELIINCTPVGMDVEGFRNIIPVPAFWNLKDKYIFDMVYKPVETEFLRKAKKDRAAEIIDGIDMLVGQGVYSFKIWFDIMPEDSAIKKAKEKIKKHLAQQY